MKASTKTYIKHSIFLLSAIAIIFLFNYLTSQLTYHTAKSGNFALASLSMYIVFMLILWHAYGFHKTLESFLSMKKNALYYILLSVNILFVLYLIYIFCFPFILLMPIRLMSFMYLPIKSHNIVSVYLFIYILNIVHIIKKKSHTKKAA